MDLALEDPPGPRHTATPFEAELAELKGLVGQMAAAVLQMFDDALRSLMHRDGALARSVPGRDGEVDQTEMAIDRLCTQILALRQPAASDLRYIAGSFKLATDLERVGDLASHVGDLVAGAPPESLDAIPAVLMLTSRDMLFTALWALQELDPQRARTVLPQDRLADRQYRETIKQLTARMRRDPERVEDCARWLFLAKHLERVADHATNIAETVIYMALGEDVRHLSARARDPTWSR